ncbi:hypothetical protein D3I60_05550 [Brevibacterium permense]|nr:hypothetical protein [Brevibacterium permense]
MSTELPSEQRPSSVKPEEQASSANAGADREVQFYRFESEEALDSYLTDPRRQAQAAERDRVIARTELFPVSLLPSE